jgi:hypothetical protein
MNAIKTSFTRNLRGYLNAARITGAFSSGKAVRSTPSLSSDPVEPIDAVFSTLSENYETPDHLAGFQNVTQQLLASNVLENLLQIQNQISAMDEPHSAESDSPNAKAARAYQNTQQNFHEPPTATVYYFGTDSEVTPR